MYRYYYKHEYLLSGYLREVDKHLYRIPYLIRHLIKKYYPNYTVYAIGNNQCGHFGIGGSNKETRFVEINAVLASYTKLDLLSHLLCSPKYVYTNNNRLIIKTIHNELYGAGSNSTNFITKPLSRRSTRNLQNIRNLQQIQLISDENKNKNTGIDNDYENLINSINKRKFVKNPLIIKSTDINDDSLNVDVISTGHSTNHTIAVTTFGDIYVCGMNRYGQFGNNGSHYNSKEWHKVKKNWFFTKYFQNDNDRIVDIKCSLKFSLFLTKNGKVFSCGSNADGICGQSKEIKEILKPKQLEGDIKYIRVNKIAVGAEHSLLLDHNNKLWVFGKNDKKQLGLNVESKIFIPKLHPTFNKIDVINICCGFKHSLCLTTNYKLYLFGDNQYGQIGNNDWGNRKCVHIPYLFQTSNPTFVSMKIIDMSCGYGHNVLLNNDNNVVVFGANHKNQCLTRKFNKYHHYRGSHDEVIQSPSILSKEKDIGIKKECFIEKVLTESESTIIIVNNNKKLNVK